MRLQRIESSDRLKHDCIVTELMRQRDYTTKVIQRCTYHVESQTALPSTHDSVQWARNLDPLSPR